MRRLHLQWVNLQKTEQRQRIAGHTSAHISQSVLCSPRQRIACLAHLSFALINSVIGAPSNGLERIGQVEAECRLVELPILDDALLRSVR